MHQHQDCLLLVFVKNPQLGKVKTRLSATVGPEEALRIYMLLMEHTKRVAQQAGFPVAVYYSDEVPEGADVWEGISGLQRRRQEGVDLGWRMENAFSDAFSQGYKHVCIIGSDCPLLGPAHLNEAFEALQNGKDVAFGPAEDGGYYLLGMCKLHAELFREKPWSTSQVAELTLQDCLRKGLHAHILPILSDIDTEADWKAVEEIFMKNFLAHSLQN